MMFMTVTSIARRTGSILCAIACTALLPALSHAQTIPERGISSLKTIYVLDAASPWFATWYERQREKDGFLFRPEVRAVAAAEVFQQIADDPNAAGLVTRSTLEEFGTEAGGLRTAPLGTRACAAFMVRGDSKIEELGDLAMSASLVAAAPDMTGITRTLLSFYPTLEDRFATETSHDALLVGIASGTVTMGVFAVEDGQQLVLPRVLPPLHPMAMSELAAETFSEQGHAQGDFDSSWLARWLPMGGTRTICDDLLIIASGAGSFPLQAYVNPEKGFQATASANGLLARSLAALSSLRNVFDQETSR